MLPVITPLKWIHTWLPGQKQQAWFVWTITIWLVQWSQTSRALLQTLHTVAHIVVSIIDASIQNTYMAFYVDCVVGVSKIRTAQEDERIPPR